MAQGKHKNSAGFTVIELLVVFVIIGILVSIGVVSAKTARERSRDNERKATLEKLAVALELYRERIGSYPSTGGLWYSSDPLDTVPNNDGNWIPGLKPTYVPELPSDPLGGPTKLTCYSPVSTLCTNRRSAYTYKSDGYEYALLANCSPERPIVTTDKKNSDSYYIDPRSGRRSCAYKLYSGPNAMTW